MSVNPPDRLEETMEFFSKKGSIGIIVQLDRENGDIQKELTEKVHIVEDTVSKRLDTATKLGLIRESRASGDHGNADRFYFNDPGLFYRELLEMYNIHVYYRQFLESKGRLDTQPDQMFMWVNEFNTALDQIGRPPSGGAVEQAAKRAGLPNQSQEITDEFVSGAMRIAQMLR